MAPGKPGKTGIFSGSGKSSSPNKPKVITDRDRPTRTLGLIQNEYDEEIALVIWKYKNIASCGHAALKLKKWDDTDNKVTRLDYISWWPDSNAFIDPVKIEKIERNKLLPHTLRHFQPRGGGAQDYKQDEYQEMGADKTIAIFLSYLYQASYEDAPDYVTEAFEQIWNDDDVKKYHEKWRAMGFEKEFCNMGSMINQGRIGLGKRQKLQKDSIYRDPQTRGFNIGLIKKDVLDGKLKQAEMAKVAKLPDQKIYLPCAYLNDKDNREPPLPRFVWGLSLDAIRLSWRMFKNEPNPQWQMITNTKNCASVVWNRLMDGYADALLQGDTGDLIAKLKREIYIQPNNIIELGEKLEKALAKLNVQQQTLDAAAKKHYPKIYALAASSMIADECKKTAERLFNKKGIATAIAKNRIAYQNEQCNVWPALLNLETWKKISSIEGRIRPLQLKKIDDELNAFQINSDKIDRYEEHRIVESLLQDEKRYLDLNKQLDLAKLSANYFGKSSPFSGLKEKIEVTREMMKINAKVLTNHRHEKVKHLVKLHNAIFKYVESVKDDDERLPSVLFLGQCVACASIEAMHHGAYVILSPEKNSFSSGMIEGVLNYQEAVVSPSVPPKENFRIMGGDTIAQSGEWQDVPL